MLRECQVYENKFKIISRCYVILAVNMSCYIFVRIFLNVTTKKDKRNHSPTTK